jgi:hypothetical protein
VLFVGDGHRWPSNAFLDNTPEKMLELLHLVGLGMMERREE